MLLPPAQLPEGTRLSLPQWLVKHLLNSEHVDVELPKCYNDAYRKGMRADASHMDLRAHSDFFFEEGFELSTM